MREVLISIQPKWVEKICRGEKTVEVRKNHPKCEVPFKCYIYCTMPKNKHDNLVLTPFGYDVGSESAYCNYIGNSNGKVIGEFVCDRIIDIPHKDLAENFRRLIHDIITPSCLKVEELKNYLGCKDGYGWHITDLVIYDKPRELSEFATVDNEAVQSCNHRVQSYYDGFCNSGYLKCGFYCSVKDDWCDKCKTKPITRAPQSWQFCVTTEPRQTAD